MVRRQILLKTNTWLDASQVGRTDRFQVVTHVMVGQYSLHTF